MLIRKVILLLLLFSSVTLPQNLIKIAVIHDSDYSLVDGLNINGSLFLSIQDIFSLLDFKPISTQPESKLRFENKKYTIELEQGIPFYSVLNKQDSTIETKQMLNTPDRVQSELYINIQDIISIAFQYSGKKIIAISPNRLKIIDQSESETIPESKLQVEGKNTLEYLKVVSWDDKVEIRLRTSNRPAAFYNFYKNYDIYFVLWGVSLSDQIDSVIEIKSSTIIDKILTDQNSEFAEIKFLSNNNETITEILQGETERDLIIRISERDFGDWYSRESEHFKIVYRDAHSHLVNHILSSAENSLKKLKEIFHYEPSQKIIINTYDVNDYGFGATTTVPENYIRLEIEPLEPGYEMIPYTERYQWLLSHELVHIVVNDMANNVERGLRSVFQKVNPDKTQPLTVFYSLLTNHNRYTPRWHQESMAVFVETWFSGGFGRVLGSFDEMYFRTLVDENVEFPSINKLEEIYTHTNFMLETLFYIYGGRFITHVASKYGVEKVVEYFTTQPSEFYPSYGAKFKDVFGVDIDIAWNDFIQNEVAFQKTNLDLIKKYPVTELKPLNNEVYGWVTQPYFDRKSRSLLFGYHREGELAGFHRINILSNKSEELFSLASPSIVQIASTAFDEDYQYVFYTTNNNQLYRDVWLYDIKKDKSRCIFPDYRVGHLTISPVTHELWGIQHLSGKAILVRSKYPYTVMESLTIFEVGDEITQLAINKKGNLLAATLHRNNGQQSIILADITGLDKGEPFIYKILSLSGSPENPSWSEDGKSIYWNAYINGVSNIYKYNIETESLTALSNTTKGLFRPVEISPDSIFAMEFSHNGFKPVLLANERPIKLPAINYFGQRILDRSPEVTTWTLPQVDSKNTPNTFSNEITYNGIENLKFQAIVPIVTGFQKRVVLGLFAHLNDPLLIHDFIIETGVSPFKETTNDIKYHLRFKYSLKQKYIFSYDYNAPDFMDLFNTRKRGMLGSKFTLSFINYWLFDNPQKIKQNTELSFYRDIKFINDNLTEVRQPDFGILKTEIDSRDMRRTIGSIDYEVGNQLRLTLLAYASNPKDPLYSGQIFGEWDNYSLFLFDHNVIHFKVGAGYHFKNDKLPETSFFFGGFGNREIENEPVRQFEKVFRFPGIPIYSIISDQFAKVMFENMFPPIRFGNISVSDQSLKNINLSVFTQGLISEYDKTEKFVDVGGQINFMFNHWSNLESTLSAGVAKAWWKGGNDVEWFISYKLLKD